MSEEDIVRLYTAIAAGPVAYIGWHDTFRPVIAVGFRDGEPAVSFHGGDYAALAACSLDMFVRYSPLGVEL